MEEIKIFFNPGDLVKVKHDINNVPIMYVVEKVTRNYNKDNKQIPLFLGIRCRWFDTLHNVHDAIFSSKDLIHI